MKTNTTLTALALILAATPAFASSSQLGSQVRTDQLRGDMNRDGQVDESDLRAMERAWFQTENDANYTHSVIMDVNGDGSFNIQDVFALGQMVYGESETAPEPKPAPREVVTRGDVDGDGQVTIADFYQLGQHLGGQRAALRSPKAADINDDGRVTIADLIAFAAELRGKSEKNPSR